MKQQLVVVSGPDMCAKTEISTALSYVTGVPRFKASSEHNTFLNKSDLFINQLRYADTRLVDFIKQTGASAIFDRAWPCEFAYSKALYRQTDHDVLRHVDSEMADMGAVVVVCHRSSYKDIVDDLDPTIEEVKLAKIEQAYREFIESHTKCRSMFLNVDDHNLIRQVGDVLKFLGYDDTERRDMLRKLPY
jgi:hypothetical protein